LTGLKNIKEETGYYCFREVYSNRFGSFTHKGITVRSDTWPD